jgi:hypothetical protein
MGWCRVVFTRSRPLVMSSAEDAAAASLASATSDDSTRQFLFLVSGTLTAMLYIFARVNYMSMDLMWSQVARYQQLDHLRWKLKAALYPLIFPVVMQLFIHPPYSAPVEELWDFLGYTALVAATLGLWPSFEKPLKQIEAVPEPANNFIDFIIEPEPHEYTFQTIAVLITLNIVRGWLRYWFRVMSWIPIPGVLILYACAEAASIWTALNAPDKSTVQFWRTNQIYDAYRYAMRFLAGSVILRMLIVLSNVWFEIDQAMAVAVTEGLASFLWTCVIHWHTIDSFLHQVEWHPILCPVYIASGGLATLLTLLPGTSWYGQILTAILSLAINGMLYALTLHPDMSSIIGVRMLPVDVAARRPFISVLRRLAGTGSGPRYIAPSKSKVELIKEFLDVKCTLPQNEFSLRRIENFVSLARAELGNCYCMCVCSYQRTFIARVLGIFLHRVVEVER